MIMYFNDDFFFSLFGFRVGNRSRRGGGYYWLFGVF